MSFTEASKRIAPMSPSDRELLFELIKPQTNIMESKESCSIEVSQKSAAWEEITKKFNVKSISRMERNEKELKKCWENAMSAAKKKKQRGRKKSTKLAREHAWFQKFRLRMSGY